MAASFGDALHHLVERLGGQLSGREIIQKKQRLCALRDQIVHAHGDKIDADGVMNAGGRGHFQLGADAIGRRDQQGIAIAGLGQVENAAETADSGDHSGTHGGRGQGFDGFDETIALVDIDAGIAVMKAVRVATVGNFGYPFATEEPLLN